MPKLQKDERYLPPLQDDQGKLYNVKRIVTTRASTDQLLGSDTWVEVDREYKLDDSTKVVTDDAEETFTVQTKPPKHLKPLPNP